MRNPFALLAVLGLLWAFAPAPALGPCSLDDLIAECERDPACRDAFPKLRQERETVLRRAREEPVRVGLTDPPTGKPVEVRLTQEVLAQTLRDMLSSPVEAALVPLEIHRAAQGDWKPLARLAFLHAIARSAEEDEAGTAERLDVSCVARRSFELPEVAVARTDLERLPGTYENEERGMALEVDLQRDGLVISVLRGGPPFPPARLIPTSPTRFRWEGEGMAPGLAVVFQVAEGRAAALSVIQPNKPAAVVLKRSEEGLQGRLIVLAALFVLAVLLLYRGTAATRNGRAVTALARGCDGS